MNNKNLPSIEQLSQRFGGYILEGAERVRETEALLSYLELRSASHVSPAAIRAAIASASAEDELASFNCKEGIAVSHASDGWWLLLEADAPSAEGEIDRDVCGEITSGTL